MAPVHHGYDAVLLDMDGVVVEPSPARVYEEAADEALRAVGVCDPDPEHRELLRSLPSDRPERLRSLARACGVEADELWRVREHAAADRQREAIAAGEKPLYGDVEQVRSLDARVGIVSNNQDRTVEEVVSRYGLDTWVDSWTGLDPTVEGLRRAKPSPWYLESVLDALNATTALYVGDAPSDVQAARRAGIDSVYLRREHTGPLEGGLDPTHELPSLRALEETLR
jgi:HAD superfamily hydrolase (TIGR01549 family)